MGVVQSMLLDSISHGGERKGEIGQGYILNKIFGCLCGRVCNQTSAYRSLNTEILRKENGLNWTYLHTFCKYIYTTFSIILLIFYVMEAVKTRLHLNFISSCSYICLGSVEISIIAFDMIYCLVYQLKSTLVQMYIIILATKEIFYFNLSLFSNFICLFLALFHCWVPFLIIEWSDWWSSSLFCFESRNMFSLTREMVIISTLEYLFICVLFILYQILIIFENSTPSFLNFIIPRL